MDKSKFNDIIDILIKSNNLPPNIAIYKLNSTQSNFKEFVPCQSIINQASKIFLFDLIKYSRNGGDKNNLTANNVYKFLYNLDNKWYNENNSL